MIMVDERTHPDRTAAALEAANFRRLWSGESVSLLGNATSAVLIPLLAVQQLQAGAVAMGVLSAAAWLPWLVLGLPAGAWLDTWPSRRVMIIANLGAAAAVASVPIALVTGVLSLPQLVVVALVSGTATVFFRGAYAKLLPSIVAPSRLETANARMFGTESAVTVAGPGLAGALTQWGGVVIGLVLDVASYLLSVVCLSRLRLAPSADAEPVARVPLRARMAEGIRFIVRDRYLRALVIIGGASNFGLTGYAALLVLYFVRVLGLDGGQVGVMLMISSVGGVLGSLLAGPLSRRLGSGRASTVLMVAGGPAALLIPLADRASELWWCAIGFVLVGTAVVAGNVIRSAWRQTYVPLPILGRVTTSSQVINFGTMPVAGLVAGWLGTQLGVRETMLIMAGVHAIASCAILATPLARCRMLPKQPG